MKVFEVASVKGTNESSPAPLVLGSGAMRASKPVKRAAENGLWLMGVDDTQSSVSRTGDVRDELPPAMNRWAIFGRPLHGLATTTSSFMNSPG